MQIRPRPAPQGLTPEFHQAKSGTTLPMGTTIKRRRGAQRHQRFAATGRERGHRQYSSPFPFPRLPSSWGAVAAASVHCLWEGKSADDDTRHLELQRQGQVPPRASRCSASCTEFKNRPLRVGLLWVRPLAVMGLSSGVLGASWAFLGPSWAVLGASRAVLGLSWVVLGLSWRPLGLSPSVGKPKRRERQNRSKTTGKSMNFPSSGSLGILLEALGATWRPLGPCGGYL